MHDGICNRRSHSESKVQVLNLINRKHNFGKLPTHKALLVFSIFHKQREASVFRIRRNLHATLGCSLCNKFEYYINRKMKTVERETNYYLDSNHQH